MGGGFTHFKRAATKHALILIGKPIFKVTGQTREVAVLCHQRMSFIGEVVERERALLVSGVGGFLDTHFGTLVGGIAIVGGAASRTATSGVEYRQFEEAVAVAVPSPVDVVESIPVVAVADEGMSSSRVGTMVDDWPPVLQLVVNQIVPSFGRIVGTSHIACVHVIVEVVAQGLGKTAGGC